MVVLTPTPDSLLLVHQTDHAAVAAQAADAWQRPAAFTPELWQRFLHIVQHHDDGWIESQRLPHVSPAGQPYDFKHLPTPQHIAIWRRSIDLAQNADVYAALVIALHARWLYTHIAMETTPEDCRMAQAFIDELAVLIDRCLRALAQGSPADRLAMQPQNLMHARRLLGMFDALSLMLLGAIPWMHATDRVPFGPLAQSLALRRHGDDPRCITITPWPFTRPSVRLTTRAWRLARTNFAHATDLADHLDGQTPCRLDWTLHQPAVTAPPAS